MNVQRKNGQSKRQNDIKYNGYKELQKYHNTMVIRGFNFLKLYINSEKILLKEHILPIDRHLKDIKKINKNIVVLLRSPENTLNSYKRVLEMFPHIKIDFDKMLDEIKLFYNAYMEIDDKIYLKVTFEDLIDDYEETIKKILKHYGIKIPKIIPVLDKRNYTWK
jgi:hypothetical protein